MDDTALIERLRSDLHAERAATVAPDVMHVSGHRRWQRRRARRVRVGGALAVVLVLGGAAFAADRLDDGEPVETRRLAPIETPTTVPEGPSQAAEDAARDGVDPDVAAMPMAERRGIVVSEEGPPEGRYAINRPPGDAAAEVLVLGADDRIVRAFPMGRLDPTWLDVTPYEVYGGRFTEEPGAGRTPYGTIFRIDRRTLELTGFVFLGDHGVPAPLGRDGFVETTADQWAPAPTGVFLHEHAVAFQRRGWEPAVTADEPVWVDRAALAELFAQG
jgi:hypothetical protein